MKRAGIMPIYNGPTMRITCDDQAAHPERPLVVAVLFREQHPYPGEHRRRLWHLDLHSQVQFLPDGAGLGSGLLALPSRDRVRSTEDDNCITLTCPQCAAGQRIKHEKATPILDRLHAADRQEVSLSLLAANLREKRK